MATKKKDVELSLKVTTDGADAVKGLTTSLRDLAKEGGEAAPEFQRLATEIDKIGQQSDAIAAFGSLKRSVADTSAEMQQAAQRVDQLGAQLPDAAAKTEVFAQSMDDARRSLTATKELQEAARVSLRELRDEYPKGSRNVDEYRAANSELQTTIKTLGTEVSRLKGEYKESEAASRQAAAEERKLVAEYNQSLNAARQVSAELGRKTAALNASRTALAQEGVATTDLVAAQNQLKTAFAQIKGEVDQRAEAYRRSVTTTQQLAQAEKDLVAQLEFESRAAREAAAAEAALSAKRQEAVVTLRAQAAATQAAIDQAFSRTGLRSAQAIETEIRQINESLNKLAFNARVSGAEFDRAFSAGQGRIARLRAELDGTAASTAGASKSFSLLSGALNPAVIGAAAAAAAIGTLGRGAVESVVQIESLRRSLTLVTGSTAAANEQIELLRKTANTSGIAIGGISDSFVRFNASARTAGISGKVVEEVFTGVTNVGAKLGISTQRVGLSLDALAQIAAKGTVSMEELRQQLGDSFPGALDIAAKGLGITQKELIKLVESGQLLAEDFLPAFGEQLKKQFGDSSQQVDGLAQAWARFTNQLTLTGQALGEGAIGRGLGAVASAGAEALKAVQVQLVALDTKVLASAESVRAFFGYFKEGATVASVGKEIGKAWDEANVSFIRYRVTSGLAVSDAERLALTIYDSKKAIEGASQATTTSTAATASASVATQDLASKLQAVAQASRDGTTSIVALGVEFANLAARAEELRVAAEKTVEIRKIEGDAAVRLAELSGGEIAANEARVKSSQDYVAALGAVVNARRDEVSIQEARIASLRTETEEQRKLADAETVKLQAKQLALDKSRELLNVAAQEAAAARTSAVAYQDNATRIAEFRSEVERAQVALSEISRRFAEDRASKEDVQRATIALAEAQGKLKDAINDADRSLQRNLDTLRADYAFRVNALKLKLEEARLAEQSARAANNEADAIAAKNKQAEIEVAITRVSAEAKSKEADEIIRVTKQRIEELSAAKQLTPALQQELETRIKNAEAKKLEASIDNTKAKGDEAKASKALADALDREANSRKKAASTSSSSAPSSGGGYGGGGSGGGGRSNNGGYGGGTKDPFTSAGDRDRNPTTVGIGETSASSSNRDLDVLEQLLLKERAGTLSAQDVDLARAAVEAATFNQDQFRNLTPGARGLNGQQNVDSQVANARRLLALTQQSANTSTGGSSQTSQSGGGSRTVNINIGGFGASVNVASQKDSDALVAVLRQVESAATRV